VRHFKSSLFFHAKEKEAISAAPITDRDLFDQMLAALSVKFVTPPASPV
jgi:hypothetical protein